MSDIAMWLGIIATTGVVVGCLFLSGSRSEASTNYGTGDTSSAPDWDCRARDGGSADGGSCGGD